MIATSRSAFFVGAFVALAASSFGIWDVRADSVNSPNITLNVDTNRNTGAGAGNASVTINTITIAEITLPEYSSGSTKTISLSVRPGYRIPAGTSKRLKVRP